MNAINCPICASQLVVTAAKGRKSNKPFIMLKCGKDGRHFRGFITDQKYVSKVIEGQDTGETDRHSPSLPALTEQTLVRPEENKIEKRSFLDRLLNKNPDGEQK